MFLFWTAICIFSTICFTYPLYIQVHYTGTFVTTFTLFRFTLQYSYYHYYASLWNKICKLGFCQREEVRQSQEVQDILGVDTYRCFCSTPRIDWYEGSEESPSIFYSFLYVFLLHLKEKDIISHLILRTSPQGKYWPNIQNCTPFYRILYLSCQLKSWIAA